MGASPHPSTSGDQLNGSNLTFAEGLCCQLCFPPLMGKHDHYRLRDADYRPYWFGRSRCKSDAKVGQAGRKQSSRSSWQTSTGRLRLPMRGRWIVWWLSSKSPPRNVSVTEIPTNG